MFASLISFLQEVSGLIVIGRFGVVLMGVPFLLSQYVNSLIVISGFWMVLTRTSCYLIYRK